MSNKKFKYTYTALSEEERKEIEYIKNQYAEESESTKKLNRLKHLDNKVSSIPNMVALSIGIIGLLKFGLGMSLALEFNQIILGIICSIIGTMIMIVAYPLHKITHNYYKKKYTDEILKLSQELLDSNESD